MPNIGQSTFAGNAKLAIRNVTRVVRGNAPVVSPDPTETYPPQPPTAVQPPTGAFARGPAQVVPSARWDALRDMLRAVGPGRYTTDMGEPLVGSVMPPATTSIPTSSVMSANAPTERPPQTSIPSAPVTPISVGNTPPPPQPVTPWTTVRQPNIKVPDLQAFGAKVAAHGIKGLSFSGR